jgi:hypothetical protein
MTVIKGDENQGFPPQELMDAIDKLGEEGFKNGTLVQMGGLYPSAAGTRVRLSGGEVTVTDGPFAEAKEVIGGWALWELSSKEEAVQQAVDFMELHKKLWPEWEGESEIRQVYGPDEEFKQA